MSKILKTLATAVGILSTGSTESTGSKQTQLEEPVVKLVDLPFTPEQCQRFEFYTGETPTAEMKEIPKDIIGLGYQFYPVVITSNNQQELQSFVQKAKFIIRPCINVVRGPDFSKEVNHTDKEIIQNVTQFAVQIGFHPIGHHLGINERFFDPQEVIDAIEKLKSNKDHHFVGIIYAFDTIEVIIDDNKYWFEPQKNCQQRFNNILMNGKTYPRYELEGRIFNWIYKIDINKITTVPDSLDKFKIFDQFNN